MSPVLAFDRSQVINSVILASCTPAFNLAFISEILEKVDVKQLCDHLRSKNLYDLE